MEIKNIFIFIAAISLTSCATSRTMYLPDGTLGHNIECNGSANTMSNCFQKAGELCGAKGYTLLNREGQAIPFGYSTGKANVNAVSGQAGYITQRGMFVSRSLFIKCKK